MARVLAIRPDPTITNDLTLFHLNSNRGIEEHDSQDWKKASAEEIATLNKKEKSRRPGKKNNR
jgi:hypothetical protein